MNFNPQAVLGYAPRVYEGTLSVQSAFGPTTSTFQAERKQNSGRYSLHAPGYSAQLVDRAKVMGIEARSHTYSQEELCRLLYAFDAKFSPNNRGGTAELCALLETQVEVLGSGKPVSTAYLRAQLEFETISDSLLKELQSQVYPAFTISTVTNPLRARSIGKRREGVFLWPDWKDSRYVNLVISCEPAVHSKVRDLVLDWSETKKVRLNPRTSF